MQYAIDVSLCKNARKTESQGRGRTSSPGYGQSIRTDGCIRWGQFPQWFSLILSNEDYFVVDVQVKFGSVTHKTDVFPKCLNPIWNSEWFQFEVMNIFSFFKFLIIYNHCQESLVISSLVRILNSLPGGWWAFARWTTTDSCAGLRHLQLPRCDRQGLHWHRSSACSWFCQFPTWLVSYLWYNAWYTLSFSNQLAFRIFTRCLLL